MTQTMKTCRWILPRPLPMSTRILVCVMRPQVAPLFIVAGIFFSKDRREEVIEVEEDPESTVIDGMQVKIMTQGEWMKGCPEGGEQSFLFALYSQLTEGKCCCPNDCGTSISRSKGDFFGIFVSPYKMKPGPRFDLILSRIFLLISSIFERLFEEHAQSAKKSIVMHAANPSLQTRFTDHLRPPTMIPCFIVLTCKA